MKPPWNTYPGLHGQWCSMKSTGPLARPVDYSSAVFWQGRNLGSLPLRIEMKVSRGELWAHIGASSVRHGFEVPSWRQIITNTTGTILMSLLMDSQLWSSRGDNIQWFMDCRLFMEYSWYELLVICATDLMSFCNRDEVIWTKGF